MLWCLCVPRGELANPNGPAWPSHSLLGIRTGHRICYSATNMRQHKQAVESASSSKHTLVCVRRTHHLAPSQPLSLSGILTEHAINCMPPCTPTLPPRRPNTPQATTHARGHMHTCAMCAHGGLSIRPCEQSPRYHALPISIPKRSDVCHLHHWVMALACCSQRRRGRTRTQTKPQQCTKATNMQILKTEEKTLRLQGKLHFCTNAQVKQGCLL